MQRTNYCKRVGQIFHDTAGLSLGGVSWDQARTQSLMPWKINRSYRSDHLKLFLKKFFCTATEAEHLRKRRRWWLITQKVTEWHRIPKVKLKTLPPWPSDLSNRSFLKRKRQGWRWGRRAGGLGGKIKRVRAWLREVNGPCRHPQSQQAQTEPAPRSQQQILCTNDRSLPVKTSSKTPVVVGVEWGWQFGAYFNFSAEHLCTDYTGVLLFSVLSLHRAAAAPFVSADLFTPQNVRWSWCLLLTQAEREGGAGLCSRWDFADSIFTHQTQVFPVSTGLSAARRSSHLCFSPVPSCQLVFKACFCLSSQTPCPQSVLDCPLPQFCSQFGSFSKHPCVRPLTFSYHKKELLSCWVWERWCDCKTEDMLLEFYWDSIVFISFFFFLPLFANVFCLFLFI